MEEAKMQEILLSLPRPTSKPGYKDHPLYVLQSDLLKWEAIYPRETEPLGTLTTMKGKLKIETEELIFPRSTVYQLHTRDKWLQQVTD